ncbi:MAG: hypothetical protein IJW03_03560 [Clostridia bacterium]|nr:hypothetical protein [Clostridia bacterium]
MHIKITYPTAPKGKLGRKKLLNILRWPFLAAALGSTIANLCVGGPYWFVIVILALYAAWKLVFSIDLVEYNRTSQSIKAIMFICILLTLIDVLLAPGWAVFVVPIVCFSGLIFCAVLFFTDLETQKHNMLPLILLIFFSIIASGICLIFWHDHDFWPFIVLGGVSLFLLVSFVIILGADFRREMQRRFHIK